MCKKKNSWFFLVRLSYNMCFEFFVIWFCKLILSMIGSQSTKLYVKRNIFFLMNASKRPMMSRRMVWRQSGGRGGYCHWYSTSRFIVFQSISRQGMAVKTSPFEENRERFTKTELLPANSFQKSFRKKNVVPKKCFNISPSKTRRNSRKSQWRIFHSTKIISCQI